MKYTPKLPESNDNVTPESPVKAFFILTGGLAGIAFLLYLALGLAVDLVVPRISVETEMKLAGLFRHMAPESTDTSPQAAYLQSLVDKLSEQCVDLPYKVKVFIMESETANAVAFPGGTVMVFSGLLEQMGSENELAFVLGHEFGHFINRDHLKGFGRSLLLLLTTTVLFGPESGTAEMVGSWINIFETGFSRAQETRADRSGLAAVNCRYGHVSGSTDFFTKMMKTEDKTIFGQYFSSHPDTARRIRDMQAHAGEKGFPQGTLTPLPTAIP